MCALVATKEEVLNSEIEAAPYSSNGGQPQLFTQDHSQCFGRAMNNDAFLEGTVVPLIVHYQEGLDHRIVG